MSNIRLYLPVAALIGASLLGSRTAGTSGGYLETNLSANARTETDSNPVVLITDLAADVPNLIDTNGILHGAAVVDPNLVNPWGIAESSGSPFWVSDNNQGVSTLYRVPGANNTPVSINPLVVSIPSPSDLLNPKGAPTGAVFNLDLAGQGFKISGVDKNNNAATAAAIFLFATEDGTIVGWNPGINPAGFDPNKAGTGTRASILRVLTPTRRGPTASSRGTIPRTPLRPMVPCTKGLPWPRMPPLVKLSCTRLISVPAPSRCMTPRLIS